VFNADLLLHVVVELGEGGAVRGAKEGPEDQKLRYRSWIRSCYRRCPSP